MQCHYLMPSLFTQLVLGGIPVLFGTEVRIDIQEILCYGFYFFAAREYILLL